MLILFAAVTPALAAKSPLQRALDAATADISTVFNASIYLATAGAGVTAAVSSA
jgi:hypothetical protein